MALDHVRNAQVLHPEYTTVGGVAGVGLEEEVGFNFDLFEGRR